MELKIQQLSKQYGKNTVINDVSLTFRPGIYGLLGANGAGKTTLMQMLCGILKPTQGRIDLNGSPIDVLGEAYLDILGYLPQGFGYYPFFTGREFLMYMAALKGIEGKQASQKTSELLVSVGLEAVAEKKIKTYSGGMKQRLGIAQALINDPKILILDEPTTGLDPKERIRLRSVLSNLSKSMILILSTHIVSDIESIADQIVMLKKGQVGFQGSVKEIVSTANGMVWEGQLPLREFDKSAGQFCVSHQKCIDDGIELRIVSPKAPYEHFRNVTPSLEDVFLYTYLNDHGRIQEVTTL